MTEDAKFLDLPEDFFPLTVEFYLRSSGSTVHTIHVDEPGAFVVPPLAEQYGEPFCVRIKTATGLTTDSGASQ